MIGDLQRHHYAIRPVRRFDHYPSDNFDGWGSHDDAAQRYFAKGDQVMITTPMGPRRALVLFATRMQDTTTRKWSPCYNVRVYHDDGTPSEIWRWVLPDDIRRGLEFYHA